MAEAGKIYLTGLQEKVAFWIAGATYSDEALGLFFKMKDLEKLLQHENKRAKVRSSSTARMSIHLAISCLNSK